MVLDRAVGARGWLGLAAIVIGFAIGLFVLFILIDLAVYAWGFLGALLAIGAILLLIAWIYDRRQASADDY
jgi:hypothetical protein